jgi:hypothetical protein
MDNPIGIRLNRRTFVGASLALGSAVAAGPGCAAAARMAPSSGPGGQIDGSGHQLYENFWQHADSTDISHADSGQPWINTGSTPRIANGTLILDVNSGPQSNYMHVDLGSNVTHLECAGGWSNNNVGNNVLCIGALPTPFTSSPAYCPCHLVCAYNGWQYGVWGSGNGFTMLRNVDYAAGINPQFVKCDLDIPKATAHVRGADGVVTTIVDPLINQGVAHFAFFELSYTNAAPENDRVWFTEVAAS